MLASQEPVIMDVGEGVQACLYWQRMRESKVISPRKMAYLYSVRVMGATMAVTVHTMAMSAYGLVARPLRSITRNPGGNINSVSL